MLVNCGAKVHAIFGQYRQHKGAQEKVGTKYTCAYFQHIDK
jgi:hypothetical protein